MEELGIPRGCVMLKIIRKPPPNHQINAVKTNERFQEPCSAILMAKVAIPICSPTKEEEKIDELKFVRLKEIPHSTTGMSPFQLVYGRLPSEPISHLKEVWVGERNIPTTVSRSVETYLEDLIEKLRKAHKIAAERVETTQNNYSPYYNLRSTENQFKVGDKSSGTTSVFYS
ncbi:retrovirus-related Pol polyprotein from transposon opus [Trichonephila clavipes]|nr:retrovirus-related Pol polyprotein from transposon opus [Trichonephila clavipes]